MSSRNLSVRRVLGTLAAAAIAIPALAVGSATAAPVYDSPLPPSVGTTWTDGACPAGAGVTVVSDRQGDSTAQVRCVTNENDSAYASDNALQTFADAGFALVTQTSSLGAMICQVDGAPDPNPCDAWTGVWWSFWTGTEAGGWAASGTGASTTPAPTDSFIGLSLVDNVDPAPAPRAATLLATASVAKPPAEQSPAEPGAGDAVHAAADFLARELQAHDHLITNSDFPDYGLTADTVMALASTGRHEADAVTATEQIMASIKGYVGTDGETYAGATAKSLVLALTMGVDPADFGGVDLMTTLQGLETDEGRFSDDSEWGDYSNTLVQALAIIGLQGAGVGVSDAAVDFLTAAQCDDGGFALLPGGQTCISDPDVTSFAVQALLTTSCEVDGAAQAGLEFLLARQDASGGLGGGVATEGINANSTGLAGSVFASAGLADAADAAAGYLTSVQYDDAFAAALRGGIAYDTSVFEQRLAAGADATVTDQDRRTTAQAVLGLTGVSYAELAGALPSDCDTAGPAPTKPAPVGPVIETDIPGGAALPVVELGAALLFLTLIGGGAAVATARRGTHR